MWTEETFQLVRDGIDAAKKCRRTSLSKKYTDIVKKRGRSFKESLGFASLNIVIFHVKVPSHASKIQTPDIKGGDHSSIDYDSLLKLNIKIARWSQPDANIIIFTDFESFKDLPKDEKVTVIRLDVNGEEPMFERVLTMAAYVNSELFKCPTIFLDIDAFLIRPVQSLFFEDFDVGLTHRHVVGQMAINEGVIFANCKNTVNVKKFFDSYLASYLAAEESSEIAKIYTKIRRWRGGQLAINAAAGGHQFYATSAIKTDYETKIVFLPCSKYNLSQIGQGEVNRELRQRCCVLHLKGNRKGWIDSLINSLSQWGYVN